MDTLGPNLQVAARIELLDWMLQHHRAQVHSDFMLCVVLRCTHWAHDACPSGTQCIKHSNTDQCDGDICVLCQKRTALLAMITNMPNMPNVASSAEKCVTANNDENQTDMIDVSDNCYHVSGDMSLSVVAPLSRHTDLLTKCHATDVGDDTTRALIASHKRARRES